MAQKVMYPGMVNSPETTITNGISESDTIIYVLDPTRVPIPPNLMTLGTGTNAETIKVTEINDNALTVERGFQGIAKSWPAGTVIARNFTEYDYGALKENIEDLDASKETPAGAQAKAEAAAGAVQAELDAHLFYYASMQFGERPYTSVEGKIYYIDAVNGADENDGESAATAFKTWSGCFKHVPYFLKHNLIIRIIGGLSEDILIESIAGAGILRLIGDTEVVTNHVITGHVDIEGTNACVDLYHLKVTGRILVDSAVHVRIISCHPQRPGGVAIWFENSFGLVQECDFGVGIVQDAIAGARSRIQSQGPHSGSATRYGLRAMQGTTIAKAHNQPTGQTANEFTEDGGVIR